MNKKGSNPPPPLIPTPDYWPPPPPPKVKETEHYDPTVEEGMNKSETIKLIIEELERAEDKFPGFPVDPIHALAVVQEEVGETQKAILQAIYEPGKSDMHDVRNEAVQMAAMSVRFLLNIHNYEFKKSPQKSNKEK